MPSYFSKLRPLTHFAAPNEMIFKVTNHNESHYADWSISQFRVCRVWKQLLVSGNFFLIIFIYSNIQGESISQINHHFHFNTSPDFGVPDTPTMLIRFLLSFRDPVSTDSHNSIVAHCSAGAIGLEHL